MTQNIFIIRIKCCKFNIKLFQLIVSIFHFFMFLSPDRILCKIFLFNFNCSLPWNQKTPLGYFYEIIYQMTTTQCYYSFNGIFLILYISICLHHRSFYKISQYAISRWEQNSKINNKMFIHEMVQFHVTIKAWFIQSADMYSYVILVQLICSMLMMACLTFQLDLVN